MARPREFLVVALLAAMAWGSGALGAEAELRYALGLRVPVTVGR